MEPTEARNKLLTFLWHLPEEVLDMRWLVSEANNDCGAVCCVAGWTPKIFPEIFEWERRKTAPLQPKIKGEDLDRSIISSFSTITAKLASMLQVHEYNLFRILSSYPGDERTPHQVFFELTVLFEKSSLHNANSLIS